jgi:RNA polymerase sigma-70 factor (ECF subfamily)
MKESSLEESFIESFSLYGDAIFRFCIVKVSRVELAEDMTQEVFTRYWQYIKDGNKMTNTRAFLYTVAGNMAKDWYKKKKSDSLDTKMESGFVPEDSRANVQKTAEYEEVLRTIEDMEEKDKEVLLLTHVEGLSPKDIAEVIQETSNAVSVRLNRATKKLQQKLGV